MISADNTLALLACLLLIVYIGYISEKTRFGQALSAPLIILLLSFIIGNSGILPSKAPLYGVIQGILVPLAIPLLLFSADLRLVFRESKRMVWAFLLATVFTIIGALIGSGLISMGAAEPQLVGILAASYIGGSANFVATSQAVGFTDSSLYTAALTADALGAMFFLTLLMSLPAIRPIARHFQERAAPTDPPPPKPARAALASEAGADQEGQPSSESGVVLAVLLSATICALGMLVATWLPFAGAFIIAITVLSLMLANFAPSKMKAKIHFDYSLGTLFMYVFFATIGLGADLGAMVGAALPMLAFLAILVLVHIVLLVWLGARWRFTLAEMMIASSACILGPAAAAALAASKGWRHLVTPGMLVGVLGYAVATFIGITLTNLLG
ncbi:DUF819 family protein [Pseudidiomarina sp. 1APP75-32.1]|uniref:DUF819 family protein n=1 Tax=Pseudidiomarina terrestris TaxID=2820060 RepID=A0AAW7QYR4_9GAMM|nr:MULTISPECIES: DUF819 family protein [unclassified Pseudidiomarina]MDN7124889.1 DUF819 family protein [Pseudidiomarina sp. 1APP75-32.1]MDN7125958.1 DUF819 family protein [Pseudidiomarina sp. 1APR75-33.1]MEA3588122.1 DUF819 family protein [Pseudidiomarina sp. 1APP75-27a]